MNLGIFATVLAHEVRAGKPEGVAVAKAAEVAGINRPMTLAEVNRAKAQSPDVFPPAINYRRLTR